LTNFWNKKVAENKQRKYIKDIATIWLGKETMSKQAKTLSNDEIRKVLDYVATRKHSERNRAMIYTIFNTGMRVNEVANLRYKDVVDDEGAIRREIRLSAEDTKTKEARVVFVNDKLHKELTRYAKSYKPVNTNLKFFYSQKRASDGYSPNTLAQFFHYLFNRAGIAGASSHSGRRSFITNLANKGVGVRVIMGLSGHRALSSVQCYIDCNDDMKRNAINLLN
jgi:integrase/recombinase XerD